jgi:hypothetical protein
MLPTIHIESRHISTHMKNFKVQMLQIKKRTQNNSFTCEGIEPLDYPLNHKPFTHNKKTIHLQTLNTQIHVSQLKTNVILQNQMQHARLKLGICKNLQPILLVGDDYIFIV